MSLCIKHRVVLDLAHNGHQVTIPFTKGDLVAHEIIFSFRLGSSPVELPPGTLAAIFIHNGANGTGVADNCIVSHVDGTVSYIPTEDALSVAGNISCDMRIIGEGGASIGTPKFIFAVQDTGMDDTEEEIDEALKADGTWEIIRGVKEDAERAAASADAADRSAEESADSASDAASSATASAKSAGESASSAKAAEDSALSAANTEVRIAEENKKTAEAIQAEHEKTKQEIQAVFNETNENIEAEHEDVLKALDEVKELQQFFIDSDDYITYSLTTEADGGAVLDINYKTLEIGEEV